MHVAIISGLSLLSLTAAVPFGETTPGVQHQVAVPPVANPALQYQQQGTQQFTASPPANYFPGQFNPPYTAQPLPGPPQQHGLGQPDFAQQSNLWPQSATSGAPQVAQVTPQLSSQAYPLQNPTVLPGGEGTSPAPATSPETASDPGTPKKSWRSAWFEKASNAVKDPKNIQMAGNYLMKAGGGAAPAPAAAAVAA
jgi:hypothetical protein